MQHRVSANYAPVEGASSNINVYIRARPLEDASESTDFMQVDEDENRKVVIRDPDSSNKREVSFQFDRIFWTQTQQDEVFDATCKTQVDHVLNGYNSCCFAYGQTGSGKTYTMFGTDGEIRGIIPRSVEYLFTQLSKRSNSSDVAMVCSFLEIYNDQIRDLGKAYLVAMGVESSTSTALYSKTSDIFENLAGKRSNADYAPAFQRLGSAAALQIMEKRPDLKSVQDEYNTMNYEIREDTEGNVFVKDLSLVPVTTMEEVFAMISTGLRVRATHETKMNSVSSRSHTVFTITVLQRDKASGQAVTGMLNLVDLAGSERLKKSESQGVRLKEALHINSSLTALGKVIMALDPSSESSHIPYRDSKLTRVLQNSLGGNSYTSVIAAIHPTPRYYEECLSTLQFANRCRNVRNNPRVNYVDDGDQEKDRKLKKLSEENTMLKAKITQLQGGAGGAGGASGAGSFSLAKLVAVLKALGINATLSPDGNGIMLNGRRYSMSELGIDSSSDDPTSTTRTSSGNNNNGKGEFGGNNGNTSQQAEKLQKAIKDLKDSNETYQFRAKERKLQNEEQSRELQKLSAELIKCRTTIKHKEFEYTTLAEEKDSSLGELRALLEAKHNEEIESLLKSNDEILRRQQREIEKIPTAVKDYTTLFNKTEKQRIAVETPLRHEFESHLEHIDKSRLRELDNLKKQYEHFLEEKDKALQGFVDAFNAYRTKKTEQLRMAEREIVRLYDYTEQIEVILDNVEKGKYQVKQKQGARGGRSTTGMALAVTNGGHPDTQQDSRANTADEGGFGAVMLPKGLRPVNPLHSFNALHHDNGLELTKRIVAKHKDRVARLEKMKEEAFQKSLHYAAQTGATATGNLDEVLKEQVRGLLARSPTKQASPVAAAGVSFPAIASAATNNNAGGNNNSAVSNGSGVVKKVQLQLDNEQQLRPVTMHHQTAQQQSSSHSASQDRLVGTAPGELQTRSNNNGNGGYGGGGLQYEGSVGSGGERFSRAIASEKYQASEALVKELEELRGQSRMERLSVQKVLDELASNEAFQYVQHLEGEVGSLRKQLKDANTLLQSVKVANASLSRTMDKTKKIGTAGY